MGRIDIYLLADESIYIKQKNSISGNNLKVSEDIEKFFKSLSKQIVEKMKYDIEAKHLYIRTSEKEFYIHSFNKFKHKDYFEDISKKFKNYEAQVKRKNIKLIKQSIATGFVTIGLAAAIASSLTLTSNSNSKEIINDEILPLDESNSYRIEWSLDLKEEEFERKLESSKKEDNFSKEQQEKYIEGSTKMNEDIIKYKENYYKDRPFYKLSEATDYDEVIKLAANMYGLDYESAVNIVKENMDYIVGPKNEVSQWMDPDKELDRIKDLKEKGYINPDTTTVGIWLTLKNNTYKQNINATIELSNKTEEQKIQDLMDASIYLYGIEDERLLADILAIHNIESDYGRSYIAINKNNPGGIRNGDLSNTAFRTSEIGIESTVRSFLKNLDRGYYDNGRIDVDIESLASRGYNENPEHWAKIVKSHADGILENNELSKYINKNTHTIN